jgi:N-acetylglucosaminyldiphosphoundecaprenol N-acetyl-beta-D-mannosaminyltransferase
MNAIKAPARIEILNSQISVVDLKTTIDYLRNYDFGHPGYICLPNTYLIVKSYYNKKINQIINHSVLTLPDGKPLELVARLRGTTHIRSVSGYWLLFELLKSPLTHYFYGADKATTEKIKTNLANKFPSAKIMGFSSPPFLSENEIPANQQIKHDIDNINKLKPDIIWIGISSPKQDILMDHSISLLNRGLMIGVGAVFNYVAGTHKISPEWMKKLGIRWIFRLFQEPRLWKRYAYGNSLFIFLLVKDFVAQKIKSFIILFK